MADQSELSSFDANESSSEREEIVKSRLFYKRPRASRACKICHDRKVRCDVIEKHPCTNCMTFKVECIIPEPKRRAVYKPKNKGNGLNGTVESIQSTADEEVKVENPPIQSFIPAPSEQNHKSQNENNNKRDKSTLEDSEDSNTKDLPNKKTKSIPSNTVDGHRYENILPQHIYTRDELPSFIKDDPQAEFPILSSIKLDLKKVLKRQLKMVMSKAYTGSSPAGSQWMSYLSENMKNSKSHNGTVFQLDEVSVGSLARIGCFSLPSEKLCRKFIDSYFEKVHPVLPVINKSKFLKEYKDLTNPPSLLLLQSVLCLGSREVDDLDWSNYQMSYHDNVPNILFRRAKALYDSSIEANPIPLCQSLVIFTTSPSSSDTNWTSKNYSHWARTAIFTSQGFGFHKNQDNNTNLTLEEKRRYKIIWWALVCKDSVHAVVLNRTPAVYPEDYDVEMPTKKDLLDGKEDATSVRQADFFLNYIKLCQLALTVYRNQMTMEKLAKEGISFLPILKQTDILMSLWKENLPKSLEYKVGEAQSSDLLGATLSVLYHALLLWLHRATIVRNTSIDNQIYGCSEAVGFINKNIKGPSTSCTEPYGDDEYYPSWGVTFKASHVIIMIAKQLFASSAILHCSLFVHWAIYNASIMMLYHLHNKDPNVSRIANHDVLAALAILRSKKLCAKYPVISIGAFHINSIINDKQKQVALVKSILKAANKQTVGTDSRQSKTNQKQKQSNEQAATFAVPDVDQSPSSKIDSTPAAKSKLPIATGSSDSPHSDTVDSNGISAVKMPLAATPSVLDPSKAPLAALNYAAAMLSPTMRPQPYPTTMNSPRVPAVSPYSNRLPNLGDNVAPSSPAQLQQQLLFIQQQQQILQQQIQSQSLIQPAPQSFVQVSPQTQMQHMQLQQFQQQQNHQLQQQIHQQQQQQQQQLQHHQQQQQQQHHNHQQQHHHQAPHPQQQQQPMAHPSYEQQAPNQQIPMMMPMDPAAYNEMMRRASYFGGSIRSGSNDFSADALFYPADPERNNISSETDSERGGADPLTAGGGQPVPLTPIGSSQSNNLTNLATDVTPVRSEDNISIPGSSTSSVRDALNYHNKEDTSVMQRINSSWIPSFDTAAFGPENGKVPLKNSVSQSSTLAPVAEGQQATSVGDLPPGVGEEAGQDMNSIPSASLDATNLFAFENLFNGMWG